MVKLDKKVRRWMNDCGKVQEWLDRRLERAGGELEHLLEANDGFVQIESFLPPFVAEGILAALEALPAERWNETAAEDDYVGNNIRHSFHSVKQGLDEVFLVFTLLMPESLFTFSAAKYGKAGHIVPHDDRAYTQVLMDDGSVVLASRDVACIYYLTRGWTAADGGQLVDHEAPGGPKQYVPAFNSLVAFTIPRWHEVLPVTCARPRYSIFGWFLEPGQLYELNTGEQDEPDADEAGEGSEPPELQSDEQALEQQEQEQQPPRAEGGRDAAAEALPAEPQQRKRKKRKQRQQRPGQQPSPAGAPPGVQQQQQLKRKKKQKRPAPVVPHRAATAHAVPAAAAAASGGSTQQQQQQGRRKKSKAKKRLHVPGGV